MENRDDPSKLDSYRESEKRILSSDKKNRIH